MQEITRFEAEELVFNHDIVERDFYQDKKTMRFDFTLGNDQFLIVIYNCDTKEKSYFVTACKNIEVGNCTVDLNEWVTMVLNETMATF